MLDEINARYMEKKNSEKADRFIVESTLDVEEVIPGSEEEMEDVVDADSIPDDVYKRVDAELDKIVNDPNFNDDDIEDLVDDDISEDEIDDDAIEAVIDEACGAWYDNEGIGHPNTARKSTNSPHQSWFDPNHKMEGGCPVISGSKTITESAEDKCPKCGKPASECTCKGGNGKENECNEGAKTCPKCGKSADECTCGKDKKNECNENANLSDLRKIARGE